MSRTLRLCVLAVVIILPAGAAAQEMTPTLVQPDEWVTVANGYIPLQSPPATPPTDVRAGVRAPDGTQVARIDTDRSVIEVTDIWGGGRRDVMQLDPEAAALTAVGFVDEGRAVVVVDRDDLVRVDLQDGETTILATTDGLTAGATEAGGAVRVVLIRELPTGDLLLLRTCDLSSCGSPDRPLLWRVDTGAIVELPQGVVAANRGLQRLSLRAGETCCFLESAPLRSTEPAEVLATLDEFFDLGPGSVNDDEGLVALTFPGSIDRPLEFRSLADGAVVTTVDPPRGAAYSLGTWSPDGSRFAVTAVWQEPFERQVFVIDLAGAATAVASRSDFLFHAGWSDDGSLLVEGDERLHRVGNDGRITPVTDQHTFGFEPFGHVQPIRPVLGAVARYAGSTRITTAVALARAAFVDGAASVVLARADLYPDALAGAALAGEVDGPLLLTDADRLSPEVLAELERLGTSTAYVLGTTDVLGDEVADDLQQRGVRVIRLGGETRFDTAALVAAEVAATHDEVYLVEGRSPDPNRGWPDAVAVAGRAATESRPILLTDADRLPEATRRALVNLDVARVTIVGGEVAVSRAVERAVRALGIEVRRIAGDSRYATSAAVVRDAGEVTLPFLVTGANWPDALAAGPAAAHVGGQVLLTNSATLTDTPAGALLRDVRGFDRVAVVGSTTAVSQRVVREARDLVE